MKAPPKDATVEKDGLATKVLAKGTGTVHPTTTNSVTVQYAGWTTDGKMFDSSYTRGEPATFGVGGVIPGWTEALQLMVEGEKRRIWIPEAARLQGSTGAPAGDARLRGRAAEDQRRPRSADDARHGWPGRDARDGGNGRNGRYGRAGRSAASPASVTDAAREACQSAQPKDTSTQTPPEHASTLPPATVQLP